MNSFGSRSVLRVGSKEYEIYRLEALDKKGISTKHLPLLAANSPGKPVPHRRRPQRDRRMTFARWPPGTANPSPTRKSPSPPAACCCRTLPACPRWWISPPCATPCSGFRGDPTLINPLQPAELVIDHSVQVDEFGTPQSFRLNAELEFLRNKERYAFLRWGQTAFRNLAIVPPDTGIVHQVNLEYLARVVFVQERTANAPPIPTRWSAPIRTPP